MLFCGIGNVDTTTAKNSRQTLIGMAARNGLGNGDGAGENENFLGNAIYNKNQCHGFYL